ncbi:Peptidase S1 domain-containing protein [Meloidogyne graminicola]|uniref:Peptidase S1 domain-containing protein n=1 Tax=Meloidogyne graminicola TaxID=189291 RepID=A0A8T0A5G1_9BILA|nr:Peptidase S1 domain-containing protein [Meloidogyne graminicola]
MQHYKRMKLSISVVLFVFSWLVCLCFTKKADISYDVGRVNLTEESNNLIDNFLKNLKNKTKRSYRIQGGSDAKYTEAMFFVQILNLNDKENLNMCGGFAISRRFVVTTGHCFSKNENLSKILLLMGSNSIFQGRKFMVKKIIHHETEDIALVFVAQYIDYEKIINIASRGERINSFATFYGFGIQKFVDSKPMLPKLLQKATIKILTTKFTNNKYLFATTGNLESDDSGGAIIWREGGKMVAGGIYFGVDNSNNVQLFYRSVDFEYWINKMIAITLHDEEL